MCPSPLFYLLQQQQREERPRTTTEKVSNLSGHDGQTGRRRRQSAVWGFFLFFCTGDAWGCNSLTSCFRHRKTKGSSVVMRVHLWDSWMVSFVSICGPSRHSTYLLQTLLADPFRVTLDAGRCPVREIHQAPHFRSACYFVLSRAN